MIVGSHVDSVPAGGWLDGALGDVHRASRRCAAQAERGRPPVGLRLVDWADEEGARFGRSLFGSSACAGTLDPDEVRDLRDRDGERLEDVVARYDVDLDRAHESGAQLRGARAYLELHIEQGPVLESRGEPAATVLGTFGVERHVAVFTGQTAHAGATPMELRRDSFAATAAGRAGDPARSASRHDGVCTVGGATSEPGRRHRGRRAHRDAARPAPPRPGRAGRDARRGARGLRAGRRRPRLRGGARAPLVDPADPVRRPPDRPRPRGGGRVRRQGHRDPERPAPRRRRDGAPDPDRDDLLLLLAAGLAHQGGGHARGRPARGDRGLRPHGGGHARAAAAAGSCRRASERPRASSSPTWRRRAPSTPSGCAGSAIACAPPPTCARLPFTTKEELREGQRREPPFGPHLCAPRERLVRMHVTSGTTGEPVAVGFTQRDHEANSAVGGEAFRIAGLRPDDMVAHCLNYALYAGGIADHMALEASGATVVPVGTGQSRRLLELIPRLGITAIFGTLSFPAYLAGRAREAGIEPRELGLRHIVTAGEPGAGPRRRARRDRAELGRHGGRHVRDERRLVDDGRGVRRGRGPAPDRRRSTPCSSWSTRTRAPRGSSRTARPASSCGRTCAARPRRCCATARATWRGVDVAVRVRPRGAAHPHRRPPRRHAARAGRERLPAGDRRDPGRRRQARAPLRGRRGRPDRPPAAACTWRRPPRWTWPA